MYSEYDNEQQEAVTETGGNGSFYQNNKILVWVFIAVVIIAIIIFMAKKSSGETSNNNNNYAITVYPDTALVVAPGKTYNKLVALVNNNSSAVVTWTSEDENIAKVDSNGAVTGVNYGKTNIVASYTHTDGKKYETKKDVTIAEGNPNLTLTDITFKEGDLLMPIGGTYNLSLTVTPNNAYITNKVFKSSNEGVVTVDNKGYVQAISEGEATITLTVNNGAINKELKVYVNKDYTNSEIVLNPTKITLSTEIKTIKVGASMKLAYTVTPDDADTSRLVWTSSDESILKVDKNGIVQALKEGTATIKVMATSNVTDSIELTAGTTGGGSTVTEISLSVDDIYLELGQTQEIMPEVVPEDADKTLSFIVTDPSIISVEPEVGESTTITALAEGATSLTIKSNSNVTKIVKVTVGSYVPIEYVDTGSSSGSSGGSSGSSKKSTIKKASDALKQAITSAKIQEAVQAAASASPGSSAVSAAAQAAAQAAQAAANARTSQALQSAYSNTVSQSAQNALKSALDKLK